jgi:S-adenosylmethionine/arginine decarboxylase-like enzyme
MDNLPNSVEPRKTYKNSQRNIQHSRNKTRKNSERIEHHHLLIRMETQKCPSEKDKLFVGELIERIVKDIGMKNLDEPKIYYVKHPLYNEGLTAIVPIQTSHIAFHFWTRPQKNILHSPESECLLEFDIYTCGKLSKKSIYRVLKILAIYEPTKIDIDVLNRKYSLKIEHQYRWFKHNGLTYESFIDNF